MRRRHCNFLRFVYSEKAITSESSLSIVLVRIFAKNGFTALPMRSKTSD